MYLRTDLDMLYGSLNGWMDNGYTDDGLMDGRKNGRMDGPKGVDADCWLVGWLISCLVSYLSLKFL
jgi:hypothetical protein